MSGLLLGASVVLVFVSIHARRGDGWTDMVYVAELDKLHRRYGSHFYIH